MSMSVETYWQGSILYVKASGDFSLPEAKRTFLEILDAILQYRSEKVFVDGRQIEGDVQTMERFYYGEFAAHSTRALLARGAACLPEFAYILKYPQLDPRKFGETVAVNRGMTLRVFENPEEALDWLLQPAPK